LDEWKDGRIEGRRGSLLLAVNLGEATGKRREGY
jgi:hypothetical protein